MGLDKPKAVIVVAIRRRVPVAVRTTQMPQIIVPGAAAHDGPNFDRFPARSHPLEYHPGKIAQIRAAGGLAGQPVVDVVQVQVGENLAGQIADGNADAAVRRRGIENPLQHAQQRGIGHITAQRLT